MRLSSSVACVLEGGDAASSSAAEGQQGDDVALSTFDPQWAAGRREAALTNARTGRREAAQTDARTGGRRRMRAHWSCGEEAGQLTSERRAEIEVTKYIIKESLKLSACLAESAVDIHTARGKFAELLLFESNVALGTLKEELEDVYLDIPTDTLKREKKQESYMMK